MTRPRFDRRLDDAEKDLLNWLTMRNVVQQTGCTWQEAADALDKFAAEGRAVREVRYGRDLSGPPARD